MNMKQGQLLKAIYYIYGFLVLWEWLRPLGVVTDTGNLSIFLYFIGFCYLLSFFSTPMLVSISAKLLVIAYAIHRLFFEGSFFGKTWIGEFFYDFKVNISYLMSAEWWELTDSFRSLLFFILLWLLAYLIEYWIVHLKKILLFLLLTITYLAVIDTFTPYDSKGPIVRMVVLGFLMLGLLKLDRINLHETLPINSKTKVKWLVPLIIFTVVTTTVGYLAPKAAPQWPDPIPYLKGYGIGDGDGFGNGIRRVGYGSNDSTLGGPFIGDETVVFSAEVRNKQYWRVETKDVYTGKGWEATSNEFESIREDDGVSIPLLEANVETETYTAKVSVKLGYSHIVYPVELENVESNMDITYRVNPETEKVMTERSGQLVPLDRYDVTFNEPKYSMQALMAASDDEVQPFLDRYTQLPEELPNRVKELAIEITTPYENRYDKVRAVERYFRASGFVYETEQVAVPGANDDYVDQFLFETQMGYCDNFSTSMIVLLRSVGIPARWVKGYTGGDYISTLSNNNRIYEVKNANAHSWVEVFFPGTGWVAFEPTKGFSNPYSFVSEQQEDDATLPIPELQDQPETPEEDLLGEEEEGNEFTGSNSWVTNITFTDILKTLGVLLVIALVVFFTRKKWMPKYLMLRYGRFKDPSAYVKAYFALIGALKRFGLKKKDSQTLREYAAYVDAFFYSKDMRKLTVKLESIQYRKDPTLEQKEIENLRKLWENLIKNVAS
ncbi:transglutaminase family protein [Bacillus salitolerans]|uniref:Transglutaminase family protein n=1 Tax=Bacillus salitolerans TaxID=1437434 RepID=A0ABW4LT26_9BACI